MPDRTEFTAENIRYWWLNDNETDPSAPFVRIFEDA